LLGEPVEMAVDEPVRSTVSGDERASLSMMSAPVSVLGAEAGEPVADWLRGV